MTEQLLLVCCSDDVLPHDSCVARGVDLPLDLSSLWGNSWLGVVSKVSTCYPHDVRRTCSSSCLFPYHGSYLSRLTASAATRVLGRSLNEWDCYAFLQDLDVCSCNANFYGSDGPNLNSLACCNYDACELNKRGRVCRISSCAKFRLVHGDSVHQRLDWLERLQLHHVLVGFVVQPVNLLHQVLLPLLEVLDGVEQLVDEVVDAWLQMTNRLLALLLLAKELGKHVLV